MSAIPRVCPIFLKLGWITNFDMLFLVMGFISLDDETKVMLISSHHFCIRTTERYPGFQRFSFLFLGRERKRLVTMVS